MRNTFVKNTPFGNEFHEIGENGYSNRVKYHRYGGGTIKWVFPDQRRTKQEYPYSYSPHFILGDHETTQGCGADYHDRLEQWDYDKYQRCFKAINQESGRMRGGFPHWSFDDFSKFMTLYRDKPTVCTGVSEEANVSSGYPIWAIYYKDA